MSIPGSLYSYYCSLSPLSCRLSGILPAYSPIGYSIPIFPLRPSLPKDAYTPNPSYCSCASALQLLRHYRASACNRLASSSVTTVASLLLYTHSPSWCPLLSTHSIKLLRVIITSATQQSKSLFNRLSVRILRGGRARLVLKYLKILGSSQYQ